MSESALNLKWTFGFSKDIVNGVQNLSDENRQVLFYASAHTGVIYDYEQKTQQLLQGHCNAITCCVVSEDKKWIVTGDAGEDSMLVVWDSYTGLPIKTYFHPHAHGVSAVDISPDALFIATLSAVPLDGQVQQELSVWEWASEAEGALYTTAVATDDVQFSVKFNTYDIREIVTTGKLRVIFWNWSNLKLDFFAPPLSQKEFSQVVGEFTCTIFKPNSKQAITTTVDGDILIWDVELMNANELSQDVVLQRRAVKIVRVSGSEGVNGVAITFMAEIGGYVVLGNADGSVRFYDTEFRLAAWFEDMKAGPITSVSFDDRPSRETSEMTSGGKLDVSHFVVGTKTGFIVRMDPEAFNEHVEENRRGLLLVQGMEDEVHGLSTHPSRQQIAISCYSGSVQLWNYEEKRLVMMRRFDTKKLRPQCIQHSPNGKFLVIGFTSGVVKIVDAESLQDVVTYHEPKGGILDIVFSADSSFLATIDAANYVSLWRYVDDANIVSPQEKWIYIGRSKGHKSSICSLQFAIGATDEHLLVSVGSDRIMNHYNLEECSVEDGMVFKSSPIEIEQSATPTCCFWHPVIDDLQEDLVVVMNDEYKIKSWNAVNNTCRNTVIGPTFGEPVNKVINFPTYVNDKGEEISDHYCAYSTPDRVIGLMKLPFDGNAKNCMGLIAHPGEISNISLSHDGHYLLSAGGADMSVNVWQVNVSVLNESQMDNSSNVDPFVAQLEGGKDGEFFDEIKDYFYYSQLRAQGQNTTKPRETPGYVPLEELPHLMRALGYFPSEQEIANMCSEIKFSQFTKPNTENTLVDHIGLNDFIKLFVNHRPVAGIGKETIEQAFKQLSTDDITWEDLKLILLSRGEKMSELELEQCLEALIEQEVPSIFNASVFADQICGFEDYEEPTLAVSS